MNDFSPTLDTPTVHVTYLKLLCMTLRGAGVDIEPVVRDAGLGSWSELTARDGLIDHRTVNRLIAAAVRFGGKPSLGLDLGSTIQISAHGPLGYAAVASRDLLQALQTLVRFVSLRYGAVRVHLRATPDGMAFEVIERIELGEAREFMMAVLLVTVLELIEALLGHPMTDMQIDLPFAEAQWRTPIERHFRGAMRFNAPRLVFHLKQSWLAQPCITADPPAHDLACLECEKLMSKTVAASMSERVREFLQGREGYYPTLGVAARYFSMSSRTLIRRLKDENTSFQDLLDALRRERAQWYLVHTQHSIEEIAARLGYVDTTNFSRTFRRWFGMTPGEARRLGQA